MSIMLGVQVLGIKFNGESNIKIFIDGQWNEEGCIEFLYHFMYPHSN